ncbi:zinc finger protein 391-like [Stomoxys calcitrans]|uniref:C2H2-type domain-containing protein n=1 Tax=Stomoxys calcitrans TaxID=35570 RepID=A0A1I8P2Y8_STOCA|nr:zinc finger protein 391 [Stomoxys calcitrans]XP_013102630.1 zinc finger protein 391 [Stomoxys calcitrans]XP_059221756.1 zinc finger protein 391 [Stomoxys calcitrans]XP_059221829.1 zinc finger protein 391-like [Stomoxys calcitrans]
MECLLCLNTDSNYIGEDSIEWSEWNIKQLVDQHLWAIEPNISPSCLCMNCWNELNGFHKFFTRIQEAHTNILLCEIKSEFDPLEDNKNLESFVNESLNECEIEETSSTATDYGQEIKIDIDRDYNRILDKNYESDDESTDHEQSNAVSEENDSPLRRNEASDERKIIKRNTAEYDDFLKKHFQINCDKCNEPFETFPLLAQHFSQVHNERGYAVCCGNKFVYRSCLVEHIRLHVDPDYYKCSYCTKRFTNKRNLQLHTLLHVDKKYACDKCDKKYARKSQLGEHKLTHMPKPEKKFQCKECGKFYISKQSLKYHQKVVHDFLYAKVCEICGQTLPGVSSYKQHMIRHNPNPVKCEDCGLLVTSKITLGYHRKLKHPEGGNREYTCPFCQKISPNIRAHKTHVKDNHDPNNRSECNICNKIFSKKSLKRHLEVHSGSLSYTCKWCPKQFNTNNNMGYHYKKAHPIEYEEEQRKRYSGNLPPAKYDSRVVNKI